MVSLQWKYEVMFTDADYEEISKHVLEKLASRTKLDMKNEILNSISLTVETAVNEILKSGMLNDEVIKAVVSNHCDRIITDKTDRLVEELKIRLRHSRAQQKDSSSNDEHNMAE